MKVFISYTLRDSNIVVPIIDKILIQFGIQHQIFVDMYHNDSLNKQLRVMKELEASDLLILIKTPSFYQSKWVLKELFTARNRQIPIFEVTSQDWTNLSFTTTHKIPLSS